MGKSEKPENDTKREANAPAAESLIIANEAPSTLPEAEIEKCRYPKSPRWKTTAELVGIGAVVVYSIISYCQWRAQINALKVDQRAWVGITEVGITPEIKEGDVGLNVIAVNSGKSPARNMYQIAGWKLIPKEELFDCSFEVSQHNREREGVLHPNARRNLVADPPAVITNIQAAAILSKSAYFYVFGKITYDDVFKDRHETIFCMRLKSSPPAAFVPYSEYNDAN